MRPTDTRCTCLDLTIQGSLSTIFWPKMTSKQSCWAQSLSRSKMSASHATTLARSSRYSKLSNRLVWTTNLQMWSSGATTSRGSLWSRVNEIYWTKNGSKCWGSNHSASWYRYSKGTSLSRRRPFLKSFINSLITSYFRWIESRSREGPATLSRGKIAVSVSQLNKMKRRLVPCQDST